MISFKNEMIKNKSQKGIALIVTVLLMNMLIVLSLFFLSFVITEKKIASSQSEGLKAYYLAEAGIAEMVYRLKNNNDYQVNFENDPSWTETFTRDNPFGADSGFYEVSINNSRRAHGEIVSIGKIDIGSGKESQRIVRINVYKALGEGGSDISDKGGYADGNIHISLSQVNFYNGSAHSNNVFNIDGVSTVNIDTDLNAVGNFNKSWLSTVNVGGDIYAHNYPPAAPEIAMPAIDFDSSNPESYKNVADIVYSSKDFDNIIKNNNTIILNDPITYVDGDVDLHGGKDLAINGLLVVGQDFKVGRKLCNGSSCGFPSITINHTEGEASGIFAKRKVYFKDWTGEVNINGVVYASDELDILNFPLGYDFYVRGGLVSRKLDISSVWKPLDILRDEEIINSALEIMEFSPVITVEHWEEEY